MSSDSQNSDNHTEEPLFDCPTHLVHDASSTVSLYALISFPSTLSSSSSTLTSNTHVFSLIVI